MKKRGLGNDLPGERTWRNKRSPTALCEPFNASPGEGMMKPDRTEFMVLLPLKKWGFETEILLS